MLRGMKLVEQERLEVAGVQVQVEIFGAGEKFQGRYRAHFAPASTKVPNGGEVPELQEIESDWFPADSIDQTRTLIHKDIEKKYGRVIRQLLGAPRKTVPT